MFEKLTMAPPDPILGLTEAFKKDPSPNKINLGVGVYKDESGSTPIFSSVKKAEEKILEQESSKSYLPMPGAPEYGAAVQQLLFGAGHEIITGKRAVTAHTPGGTGGLRVAGEFLKKVAGKSRIWVSEPTWANHKGIFTAAGLEISSYPYYDAENKCLDFEGMIEALGRIPEGDVVLLHACCHNPSGMDPDAGQWKKIAEVTGERKLIPLFDFAYQGLANGLDEDAAGLRCFCTPGREMLVASSFSKNFGLYNERVGALTLVAVSQEEAQTAFSHLKLTIRTNYSNPPSHGGAIVTTVLADPALRAEWEEEVKAIRDRIRKMRELFVETLKAKGVTRDFSFITRQNGMFSFSGLTKEQVETLKSKNSIYIVGSGRINVAGMTTANMDGLCQAIA